MSGPIPPDFSRIPKVSGTSGTDTGTTSGSGGYANESSQHFWQDFTTLDTSDPYVKVAWDMMLDQMSMQIRQEMHDAKMAAKQYQEALGD